MSTKDPVSVAAREEQPNSLLSLPPRLVTYLRGNGRGHLKVLGTIASLGRDEEIDWAIFASAKKAIPTGDPDFTGTVDGENRKPRWASDRSLWLLPISPSARDAAVAAMAVDTKLPDLKSPEIVIRNPGKGSGTSVKYDFWYEEQESWRTDPVLLSSEDCQLKTLTPKGAWHTLHAEGDESGWPVWWTEAQLETEDHCVVFRAPCCHIVNDNGEQREFEVWFGVRDNWRPFLTISTPQSDNAGMDCPIVWFSKFLFNQGRRLDDVLKPKISERVSPEQWEGSSPVTGVFPGFPPDRVVNKINENVLPWILRENHGNREYFSTIYARKYTPQEGAFPENVGEITILQITRGEKSNSGTAIQYLFRLMVRVAGLTPAAALPIWNERREEIRMGLQAVNGAMPVGIVPRIDKAKSKGGSLVAEWETKTSVSDCCGGETGYDLVTAGFPSNGGMAPVTGGTITLPCIRHDRPDVAPGQSTVILSKAELVAKQAGTIPWVKDNGTLLQFLVQSYQVEPITKNGPMPALRDGAMSFRLKNAPPDTKDLPPQTLLGRLRLTLQLARSQRPLFLWRWFPALSKRDPVVLSYSVEDFSLPVEGIDAAGQDLGTTERLLAPRSVGAVVEGSGERGVPPLVIPIHPETSNGTGTNNEKTYLLAFSESVNLAQNHRLDVKVQEFAPAAGQNQGSSLRAVILDSNPQLVALVDCRFLQQPGFDDGAWVLARRSPLSEEGGGWELLDDQAETEGFRLILPAQVIGEAYVKNQVATAGEPEVGKPIEYRFGAPAILRLAPERLERRYVAVPWNLRRIWGKAGDAAPGTPLLEARFEANYGLTTHLKPAKAFLAELGAKLGEVPVPPINSLAWTPTSEQQRVFTDAWRIYLDFYRAWQSRLAVLEPSADDDFGKATFVEGVSFAPRISLKLTEPPPDEPETPYRYEKVFGADLRWPLDVTDVTKPDNIEPSPDLSADKKDDPDAVLTAKMGAAHSGTGLAGGFHYGFESLAIYRELWREALEKGSSSAELKELAFSSAGAWARQSARFAHDKTVIKSNTAMGRTHFYAVERIGRIGAFWNKAKHVIEYERTVVPSLQFSNLPEHVGRSLVRKVREYIEILEPTRRYPDFAKDDSTAPGAVMACTFKTKIIPVLSTWGRDVYAQGKPIGWEVPLWKRGADPKIYSKPQIILDLMPPPDSEEEAIRVNLSEPDVLWFYTDTREKIKGEDGQEIVLTADVHAWPPIPEVDFTRLPDPLHNDIAPAAGDSPELLDAPLPTALDVAPGFERFTFRVDRAEVPSAVASRYFPDAAMTGRLRTVSMMRSTGSAEAATAWWAGGKGEESNRRKGLAALVLGRDSLLAKTANGFVELDNKIRNGHSVRPHDFLTNTKRAVETATWNEPKGDAPPVKHELRTMLQGITPGVDPQNLPYFKALWEDHHGKLEFPTQILWKETLQAAEGIVNQTKAYFDTQKSQLLRELETIQQTGSQHREEARAALKRFQERVSQFRLHIEFTVDSAFTSVQKSLDHARSQMDEGLEGVPRQLGQWLDKVDPKAEITQTRDEILRQVEPAFTAAKDAITRAFKVLSLLGNATWQANLEDLQKQINDVLTAWQNELETAVEKAADNSTQLLQRTKGEVQDIAAHLRSTKAFLEELHSRSGVLVAGVREKYEQLNTSINEVWSNIEKVVAGVVEKIEETLNEQLLISKINGLLSETWTKMESLLARDPNDQAKTGVLWNALYRQPESEPTSVFGILFGLDGLLKQLAEIVVQNLLGLFGGNLSDEEIKAWLKTLGAFQRLEAAITAKPPNREAILQESTALANSINKEFGRLAGEVAQKAREAMQAAASGEELVQVGKQTLHNYRSVWEQFTAPGMGLNRDTVAMIVKTDWKDVEQRLSLTPCISRVKQFGKDLEGLGLRLPVVAITDRLLPPMPYWEEVGKSMLDKFGFSNLLSDIGGMRLDKLFPGFKMPQFARDKIRITQGFDKKNLLAWVNAEADVKLSGKKPLMSFGPLRVNLENGVFTGHLHLEIDINGKTKKTNTGTLTGSWHIGLGGTPLMIFRDASIIFRDGKLTYDLDPKRIEMPGLMKVLTDATKNLSGFGAGGGGDEDGENEVFKVSIMKVRNFPAGVRATLDIPPIDIGGGVAAITGLAFGGFFEMTALSPALRFRFLVGVGFYFGKKEKPFNLTVFILGGGGHVDGAIYYEPSAGGLTVDFSMSVHASVAFTIALGWMSGSVAIMLGFEAEYHKKPLQHAAFNASIFLLFTGYVDILSLISVNLYLLLQATYKSLGNGGSELVGTGQVRLTIRICRFVKIEVNKTYTKIIARSGGDGTRQQGLAAPAQGRLAAPAVHGALPIAEAVPAAPDAAQLAQRILATLS